MTADAVMPFFGETAATALIGHLVDKYGWGASATTIYMAVCLLIYLLFKGRHILRMEEQVNAEQK